MEKAKDCVFCNQQPEKDISKFYITIVDDDFIKKYAQPCSCCHSHGPLGASLDEAVHNWNNRVYKEKDSCPYCGGKNFRLINYFSKSPYIITGYSIKCQECGANGPFSEQTETMRDDWNKCFENKEK